MRLAPVLDGVLKWAGLVRFTRTVEDGARCEVLCATSPSAADGGYYELTAEGELAATRSSDESYDVAKARRLWELSERLTGSCGSVMDLTSLSASSHSDGSKA